VTPLSVVCPFLIMCIVSIPERIIAGTPEILEAHHGPDSTFDRPVILLDDVVRILDLLDLNGRFPFSVDVLKGSQIGSAFIDRHHLGHAVLPDRFCEITLGSSVVASSSQKEVDRVTFLVHSPIEVLPFTPDLHVGFVHPPAFANCSLAAAERLLKHGQKFDGPAVHCGMMGSVAVSRSAMVSGPETDDVTKALSQ
jgi:hypothetical protein